MLFNWGNILALPLTYCQPLLLNSGFLHLHGLPPPRIFSLRRDTLRGVGYTSAHGRLLPIVPYSSLGNSVCARSLPRAPGSLSSEGGGRAGCGLLSTFPSFLSSFFPFFSFFLPFSFFLIDFIFRAVLVQGKMSRRYRAFPYTPCTAFSVTSSTKLERKKKKHLKLPTDFTGLIHCSPLLSI